MWIASEPMVGIPIGRGVSRGFRNKDCPKKKKKNLIYQISLNVVFTSLEFYEYVTHATNLHKSFFSAVFIDMLFKSILLLSCHHLCETREFWGKPKFISKFMNLV